LLRRRRRRRRRRRHSSSSSSSSSFLPDYGKMNMTMITRGCKQGNNTGKAAYYDPAFFRETKKKINIKIIVANRKISGCLGS